MKKRLALLLALVLLLPVPVRAAGPEVSARSPRLPRSLRVMTAAV